MVCNGLHCAHKLEMVLFTGWHSADFVRLFGKDSSGLYLPPCLYVLKVGEEQIGNLVDRSGLHVKSG